MHFFENPLATAPHFGHFLALWRSVARGVVQSDHYLLYFVQTSLATGCIIEHAGCSLGLVHNMQQIVSRLHHFPSYRTECLLCGVLVATLIYACAEHLCRASTTLS